MTGKGSLLVVDDEPESLRLLMTILADDGYRVRPADSGEIALASIRAELPELILLDIRMPGIDGFAVCRRIKAIEECRLVPLIFISAATDVEERVQGLALGAVDFVSKPFQREELLARVRTHLELSRLRAQLEMQVVRRTAELRMANQSLHAELAERRRIEQALREGEEKFRAILLQAAVGIAQVSIDGEWLFLNDRYCEIVGHSQADLRGKSVLDIMHPDDRSAARAGIAQLLAGEDLPHLVERRYIRRDGTMVWVRLFVSLVRDVENRPGYFIAVAEDITEHKKTEAALRESEARFRNMADTAPVMIWVSGPDKLATFFNKGWLDFSGRTMEQQLGSGWIASVHPEERERSYEIFSSSFDDRRNYQMEHRLLRADGEYRWVLCNGVPRFEPGGVFAGYISSCFDITDFKNAHDSALARQKLESLGVLAEGIAHDFNNLLGSIHAEAELAEVEGAEGSFPRKEIETIKTIAIRASEIVRQLMIYAGHEKADCEPLDLSQLVEEMLELLKISISKSAVLKADLAKDLPVLLGNSPQIRQVVMNLVLNASDAIGERGGVITVATSVVTEVPGMAWRPAASLADGHYLRLQVSDTGPGIAKEAQAKVFDPFVTTKFAGRGLGLAVVQGIVRLHHGAIHLDSAPGKGTTFQIFLPCAGRRSEDGHGATTRAPAEQFPANSGTVLVVEDEAALRISTSRMLRKEGFSVIEAGDGGVAVDLFRDHKDDIDVVLLDMTIPGTPSRVFVAEARQIRPDIKVVLTSAYGREMAVAAVDSSQISGFIRKPFPFRDLVQLLRETMSGG